MFQNGGSNLGVAYTAHCASGTNGECWHSVCCYVMNRYKGRIDHKAMNETARCSELQVSRAGEHKETPPSPPFATNVGNRPRIDVTHVNVQMFTSLHSKSIIKINACEFRCYLTTKIHAYQQTSGLGNLQCQNRMTDAEINYSFVILRSQLIYCV